jgi:hypothetical protein
MSYLPEWGMGVIQRVFKLYLKEKRGSRGQSVCLPAYSCSGRTDTDDLIDLMLGQVLDFMDSWYLVKDKVKRKSYW